MHRIASATASLIAAAVRSLLPIAARTTSRAAPSQAQEATDPRYVVGSDAHRRYYLGDCVRSSKPEVSRTLLVEAVCGANAEAISNLIKTGADVNRRSPMGGTPLHAAATNDNPEVIITLIKAGANVNAKTIKGGTPLHAAATNDNPGVIIALITAGANVNAKTIGGETPLDRAEVGSKPKNAEFIRAAGGRFGKDLP